MIAHKIPNCIQKRSPVLEPSANASNNPKISQLALNNIISSYQRYEVDSKIEITSYANNKVKERLKELKVQMAIADENLAQYKKDQNLVDTGNVKELKIKEIHRNLALGNRFNHHKSSTLSD